MKKTFLILLFLSITYSGFSQEEKKHNFTHTLTENIGFISKFNLENKGGYPSINGAYSLLNLIPSYELGYNNKTFLKLKFRNLTNETNSYQLYLRQDAYTALFSYNLLNKNSNHSFKSGLGYTLVRHVEKYVNYDMNGNELPASYEKESLNNFLVALSYSYKVTPHFAFGFDLDLYDIIIFTEFSLALSYTF